MLLVGSTQDLTFVWPGGTQEPFIVHTGDHILHPSVSIVLPQFGIKGRIPRRQNDGPHFDFDLFRGLAEINGLMLTDTGADMTFLLFKVKTAFINIGDKGNCLREVYMDGFVLRYVLIKRVRVCDRTVFDTGRTTRAFALDNISGLLDHGDLEVSGFSFDAVNVGIGQDLYVGVPADLDQFGCEYSDGAVIGGKCLVKLGHMAANGRRLVDQVYFEASRGEIKRGLNTTHASTDNHNVSKMTVPKSPDKLFNLFSFHVSPSLSGISAL